MTSYPDLRNEYETDPTPKQSQCRTLKPSSVVLSKKVKYTYTNTTFNNCAKQE